MYDQLKKLSIPKGATKQEKKAIFNQGNYVVADTLNHIKTMTKKSSESTEKLKEAIAQLKKDIKQKNMHLGV